MSLVLYFRGECKHKEVNAIVRWLKMNKKVADIECATEGIKIGYPTRDPIFIDYDKDDMQKFRYGVVMIGNNTAITERFFHQRIYRKFDLMYSQKAYVHWYAREGMEMSEFEEARENLGALRQECLDLVSKNIDDYFDDDEDDDY